MKRPNLHIFFSIFMFFSISIFAQEEEVKIEFGKKILSLEENFTIKVTIKNSEKWEVSQFPVIQGFTKGSKQVSHTQSVQNGKKIPVHTLTQSYTPTKGGSYRVPSFTLTINEKDYASEAILVAVAFPKEDIEETPPPIEEVSIEQVKSNAFLSVSTDKNQVFVGEGFRLTLTFYLAENNTANIQFTDDKDLNAQIDAIAKKYKPADCLEERIMITQINAVPTNINGKKFSGYKVFEAMFYPLNSKPLEFPTIDLKMNLVRNNNTKESINFSTKPLIINSLDLPEHPLKDKVSVGDFYLFEQIETRKIRTGKTFNYIFKIVGNGNFSTINLGNIPNDSHFDFFQPTVKESRQSGQVKGEKEFRYRIMPKDSGQQNLANYFSWVFFNTKKQEYDTLKSRLKVIVSGKTIEDEAADSEDIYAGIDKLDTTKIITNYQEIVKNLANVVIFLILIGTIFLFDFRRKKRRQ